MQSIASDRDVRLLRMTRGFAAVIVALAAVSLLLTIVTRANEPVSDFRAFYEGADRLRAGQPLYETETSFLEKPIQYIYPPLVALLLLPFPTYASGWYAWALLSLASWLASLWLIWRELRPELEARISPLWRPVLLAALINFTPITSHFFWGQTQLPLLLLLVGAWILLRRKRDGWAGALLGLAIAIKIFPALLGLPLLLWGRWRALIVAGIVCVGVTFGTYAIVGLEQAPIFLDVLQRHGGSVIASSTKHMTFAAMLTNLTGAAAFASIASLVLRGLVLAVTAWGIWRARDAAHAFVIGMPTLFLVTPVVWEHYFVLAYLPWLVALVAANARHQRWLVLAFFLMAAATLVYSLPEAGLWFGQLLPISGALVLLAVQVAQTERTPDGRPV